MFIKLFLILLFLIAGIIVTLLLGFAEEFAERLLPVLMVGGVIVYIFLTWYLGYFLATQKPPLTLVVIGLAGIIIVAVCGYYIGTR